LGKLVAFEGIDGAGKSSVIHCLRSSLKGCNVPISICGEFYSPLAPIVRDLVRSGGSPFLKTFLFACDRAWGYERIGLPALERGELVLWDRYVDSAIAYRTAELSVIASRIDLKFVKSINEPFKSADLTVYIDISTNTAFERAKLARKKLVYSMEFLEKVRSEYSRLASEKRYCIINGEQPLDIVVDEVSRAIRQYLEELFT
jgi:dTMP kinase